MALRFTRLTRPNIRALKPGERASAGGITAVSLVGVALSLVLLGVTLWRMLPRRATEALAPGQDWGGGGTPELA